MNMTTDQQSFVEATTELTTPRVNRQLYENSGLEEMFAERGGNDGDKFFNDLKPNLAVLHEKPEHRYMIWLKARGSSNAEIAAQTGFTLAWVGQVLRQPWARQRLREELDKAGRDELSTLIKASAVDSVYTLIELRDNDNVPSAVRRASADSLLDRYLGKPTQRVETNHVETLDTSSVKELDAKLAVLEAEERQLCGTNRSASAEQSPVEPTCQ